VRQEVKTLSKYLLTAAISGAIVASITQYKISNIPIPQSPIIQKTNSYTIKPEIIKLFIKSNNEKVYNRLAEEIVDAIHTYGEKYSISPVLLIALIQAESEFNINAVSKANAKGLGQINLTVWSKILKEKSIITEEREIFDPVKNIECSCFILREYLNQSKNFNDALNKYLGADYPPYREKISRTVGAILMLGMEREVK
jgi:soluble lytic murein transglycosylase-like protein